DFPVRIHYVNFAEHLQNAYNVNVLFESEINRWNLTDWEQYIDMISFYRYNIFEFWLVPTLLGTNDEMRNSPFHQEFVKTINHVIDYARRRGVAVHPLITVNTLGGEWLCACPNDPKEKKQILDAWEFWTKSIHGMDSICIFPGDPGGCIKNGCTKETFVDLALELSGIIRKNSPQTLIEVGTWGEPFSGWGVPIWTADQERTRDQDHTCHSMEYLLEKLPQFPKGTFTSINTGFSPDSDPNMVGGDGRPYAKQASKSVPVLTWDYSVTEGEATVFPHCRLRRMITARQNELELGCYSGGICYTMAPQIQCLSAFCSAETWWNPHRTAEEILNDYGQWTFGEGNQEIGILLEEFEVIPDWGYYAPFPYNATRLYQNMNRLKLLLEKVDTAQKPRLPVAANMKRYTDSLIFFAELFRDFAEVARSVETLGDIVQKTPFAAEIQNPISLATVQDILATKKEFEGRNALQSASEKLENLHADNLKQRYWKEVYVIYDHIVAPVDPRTGAAMSGLLNRFHTSLAIPRKPSVLEKPLQSTGKPFILFPLVGAAIPGWTMSGWDVLGEDNGESWSVSTTEGTLSCNSFKNEGYKWLILRIADAKAGEKKNIWINGQKIGEFVRTGQTDAIEFVTRCFPIPDGLLKGESIEIKFTEPGIGIAGVALSVEPLK
ncbi:MAG: hypothetical protein LBU34_00950, partial [Planctomycetaceae bacterium]|nr:hypothetical protein [Planctomycetaceae bacterium]